MQEECYLSSYEAAPHNNCPDIFCKGSEKYTQYGVLRICDHKILDFKGAIEILTPYPL